MSPASCTIVERLTVSPLYQDFVRAFGVLWGGRLGFVACDDHPIPADGETGRGGDAPALARDAEAWPRVMVPVRIGAHWIGWLCAVEWQATRAQRHAVGLRRQRMRRPRGDRVRRSARRWSRCCRSSRRTLRTGVARC